MIYFDLNDADHDVEDDDSDEYDDGTKVSSNQRGGSKRWLEYKTQIPEL